MKNVTSFSFPSVALKKTRPPGAAERKVIQAQMDANRKMIASMSEEIETRNRRASATVTAHTEMLTQARLLLEATMTFRNALSAIQATVTATRNVFFSEPITLAATNTTTTEAGTEEDFMGTELLSHCHNTLDSTAEAMSQAEDVHAVAVDRLQVALIERDMANKSATAIQSCISILTEANQAQERETERRSLCGLPTEIWAQIFQEATRPDRESPKRWSASPMPRGWAHGSRAALLASVCREWRDVSIGTKSLWSTINIAPAKQSMDTISGIVKLHLKRAGPLAINLTISVETEITSKQTYNELKPILARVKKLRQLRFYLDYSARHLAGLLYGMLVTPYDLIIEATDPTSAPYIYLPLAAPGPKKVTLISCELLGNCFAPIEHMEVQRADGSYYDFGEWRQGSVESLERAVLPYKNGRVDAGAERLDAPRLKYLETTLSLLSNRILPLYNMPNLAELVITDAQGHQSRPWDKVAEQLGKETHMERLVLDDMDGPGAQTVVACLEALPSVATLELRGRSVEQGLAKLESVLKANTSSIRSLNTLVVADYAGEGRAILDFAKAHSQRRLRVEYLNCPNLSKEVRRGLSEMH
ncbi:hypothetical protein M408DRAFT_110900 [Serendipita vermifera MAFF 305830]|uniref:Uncharacterized protein n=1 Tax=Serendipita vermifera MAFF 305830 TaxID=933852 RepID=A0A0C2W3Y8_SERVB|nr:hypothetical protein M408DRAFT_110900 [Serendipita vermifera MAFF 305830]